MRTTGLKEKSNIFPVSIRIKDKRTCCGRLLSLATALIEFEQLVVLFPQLLRCVYSIPSVLGHVHRAVFLNESSARWEKWNNETDENSYHNQKCSHFELKHLSLDFRLLSSKHFVNVVKAEDAADFLFRIKIFDSNERVQFFKSKLYQTLLEVHRVPKNCCSVDDVDLFDYCWIDLSLVVVGN